MRENVQSFDELAGKIHLTHLCDEAHFQHLVAAGKQYKIRPDGDDGWGTISLLGPRIFDFLDLIRKPKLWQLFLKAFF